MTLTDRARAAQVPAGQRKTIEQPRRKGPAMAETVTPETVWAVTWEEDVPAGDGGATVATHVDVFTTEEAAKAAAALGVFTSVYKARLDPVVPPSERPVAVPEPEPAPRPRVIQPGWIGQPWSVEQIKGWKAQLRDESGAALPASKSVRINRTTGEVTVPAKVAAELAGPTQLVVIDKDGATVLGMWL